MNNTLSVLFTILCSRPGGTAATRYLVGNANAVTLVLLRWVIGFA
jgi:hypothetical protein